jgi:hypothetical protein
MCRNIERRPDMIDILEPRNSKSTTWYYSTTTSIHNNQEVSHALVRVICDPTDNRDMCCVVGNLGWIYIVWNGEWKLTKYL